MCHHRVTGAENNVLLEVEPEVLLDGFPDVDLCQDPESLLLQRSSDLLDRFLVRSLQPGGDAVVCKFHISLPSVGTLSGGSILEQACKDGAINNIQRHGS